MMNSFGYYPASEPKSVIHPAWQDELHAIMDDSNGSILPIGKRRSYGDSCLNNQGILVDLSAMNKLMHFDTVNGIIRCEAGITFKDLLSQIVPFGWFVPVSAGTQYVTLGGAIANDIHGKNHHTSGSFGNHVIRIALKRSDAEQLVICSVSENPELFYATIGGLGLTGIIVWAEFKLVRILSPFMNVRTEKFIGYEEYLEISQREEKEKEYSVAWFDSVTGGKNFMRGLMSSGEFMNHNENESPTSTFTIPFHAPNSLLNPVSIKVFNSLYYRKTISKITERIQHYVPFFYPLDSIGDWNKLYGKRGFLQYQCVLPHENARESIEHMLKYMNKKGFGSFLVVLKSFGEIESRGLLSFPMPGMTLAMDFPMRGDSTLKLLDYFDEVVDEAGGRVYPAKDARMSGEHFRSWYPKYKDMLKLKDPLIESTFWRRVME